MTEHTPYVLPDRFWAKTREGEGGCLIWTAAKNNQGYGQVAWEDRTQSAHRVAYKAAKGEPPEGWHIDHLCRVRLCVNADHLEAVTAGENNRRMIDALTEQYPGGRRYATVTHRFRDRNGFEGAAYHVDHAYMRRRCPRCPDGKV